jgi:prepilin-type N-terminal cleavage/methylation domain-containing protein
MGMAGDHRRERGFTLVECLAALALVGFAIVVAASCLTAQARAAERLKAREQLTRTAESVLESVRGGAVPLRSATLSSAVLGLPTTDLPIDASLEVERLPHWGLYEVTATTGCTLQGERVHVVLTTMVWRP